MSRSIDISGVPTRVFQYLLAAHIVFGGLFFVWICLSSLLQAIGVSESLFVTDWATAIMTLVIVTPVATVLWVRWRGRRDSDVWGPIPAGQYIGRFAGHGGLARHNWEQAIERLSGDDEEE